MKKNQIFLAFCLCVIVIVSACSKSSSSSNSSPYTISAVKGGATVTYSGQSSVAAAVSGPLLEIVGANTSAGDTTGFVFLVGNYTGVGSYTLDGTTNVGEYVTKTGSASSVILATSGTITISSAVSPYMKGTFSFTDGTTSITNGSFTAHF